MSQDDQREWEMESGVDKPRNNRGTLSLSGKVEHKIFPSALKTDGDLGHFPTFFPWHELVECFNPPPSTTWVEEERMCVFKLLASSIAPLPLFPSPFST